MALRATRDIIAVAASAGGVFALRRLLGALPGDLPASVVIVTHLPASGNSMLASVLARAGSLPAEFAKDGEVLKAGQVYVAPANRHLFVVDGTLRLSAGPRQNGLRPAADPLFFSAALAGGPRVIGVVLSGTLDDGAAGAAVIERHGGIVAVQDPAEADYDGMPRAALAATNQAFSGSVEEIAGFLVQMTGVELGTDVPARDLDVERQVIELMNPPLARQGRSAVTFAGMTCPECGGPVYSNTPPEPLRFECLIGHAWSPNTLLEGQTLSLERALGVAARQLEERMLLTGRMAESATARGHHLSARRFREATDETRQALETIRNLLDGVSAAPEPDHGEVG